VSVYNIDAAPETLTFLDGLGIHAIRILRLTPIGKASIRNGFVHVGDEQWQEFTTKIRSIRLRTPECTIQGLAPDSPKVGGCNVIPFQALNVSPSGHIYSCCLLNNRRGAELGHVSELIDGDWNCTMERLDLRARQRFDLKKNPTPCVASEETIGERRTICPLYAKKIL